MKEKRKARGSKGEGAKKKERRKRAAKALAAAGAIAGGTYAYAEPVRHDNPPHGEAGHFHWPGGGGSAGILGITLPPAEQPGYFYDPGSIAQLVRSPTSDFYSYGYGGLKLQATYPMYMPGGFALSVNKGDPIPNANTGFSCYYGYPFCLSSTGYFVYGGASYIPEGVPTYLAAAVGSAYCAQQGNCRYGWIGVVRTGTELEAFAWALESTPNTPICAGCPQPPPTGACCGPGPCQEITEAECEAMGWKYVTDELGDPKTCAEAACNNIPTVSEWGLAIMSLSLLAAGAWVVRKRIPQPKPPAAA